MTCPTTGKIAYPSSGEAAVALRHVKRQRKRTTVANVIHSPVLRRVHVGRPHNNDQRKLRQARVRAVRLQESEPMEGRIIQATAAHEAFRQEVVGFL